MFGQGAVDAGPLGVVELVSTPAGVDEARGEVAVFSHFVQMVLVDVIRIVLVETPTLVLVTPLEVWVAVTGQIVVEV
jgi:hypothetical protein